MLWVGVIAEPQGTFVGYEFPFNTICPFSLDFLVEIEGHGVLLFLSEMCLEAETVCLDFVCKFEENIANPHALARIWLWDW